MPLGDCFDVNIPQHCHCSDKCCCHEKTITFKIKDLPPKKPTIVNYTQPNSDIVEIKEAYKGAIRELLDMLAIGDGSEVLKAHNIDPKTLEIIDV